MTQVRANGLSLEYEEMGPANGSPIVLIMGLAMQLIAWPDTFCAGLAARGFRVIRFDNRDIGLSAKRRWPSLLATRMLLFGALMGLPVRPPYALGDMAEDTLGLMDALGLARAHIVGASMGGMIAQIAVAKHPERALSLVSIMSTSGRRDLPRPAPEIAHALTRRRPSNADDAIRFGARLLRLIGSPGYPATDAALLAKVERSVRRSYHPQGGARQLLAVATAPSRVEMLRGIRVPTLVVHGADDRLVPLACGEDTAANVPGARLKIIPGMGHDLPEPLLPQLVEAIAQHCAAAEARAAPGPDPHTIKEAP